MTENTINTDVTMGGADGALLAGRYRVIRQLGQGGMGSVWLAEDTKLDGFKVAIKMLPSVLVNNKRAYAQVKAEALVSLKLSHPNIVTVRAFEEEGGSPFLVMDYIDGQTLDDYLAEKGKLTEEETIRLLKPVAEALDYAHKQGVVHRDVKPGNVMIRKDGAPFVLDFGIAREIQETMTRVTGKLSSGTLLYMSPEQLNGAAPKPAQDVYSFAAMAYECLKGEPPFSRGQVEFQILNKEPEPLPGGSDLARSILRGLAKAPVARPANCMGVVAPVVVSKPRPKPTFERVSVPKDDVRFIPPEERSRFAKEAGAGGGSPHRSPSDNSVPASEKAANGSRPWIGLVGAVCLGFYLGGTLLGGPLGALLGAFGTYLIFEFTAKRVSFPLGLWNYGALVLPLALFAFLRGLYESKVAGPNDERSSAPIVQTESGEVEKPRTDVLRAMALSQIEICRRFDKGDGFKAKIEACENVLSRARTEYELKEWKKSASSYEEVVGLCKQLVSLDEYRNRARRAAAEMEKQARAAKEAEADKYAKDRFDAAKKLIVEAKKAFAEMQFAVAVEKHELAAKQFELAAGEAKAESVRLEQEKRKTEAVKAAEAGHQKNWRQEGTSFTITDKGLALTMKWCPPGVFTMGSPIGERGRTGTTDESSSAEHQRRVRITRGFWIGETEITQGQWRELMDGEGLVDHCRKILDDPMRYRFSYIKDGRMEYKWMTRKERLNFKAGIEPQEMCGDPADDIPMYYVDWYDAVEYCRRLTMLENRHGMIPDGYEYRLPTRAEWEYACRAGSDTSLPCGLEIDAVSENNSPALDRIAWYSGNSSVGFGSGRGWSREHIKDPQYSGLRAAPRVVKTKMANDWGIYDMLGNVSEWCCDYSGGSNAGGDDPLGAEKGFLRACPGGGFFSRSNICRPACSSVTWPTRNAKDTGFRVVLAQKFDGYPYGADITLVRSKAPAVGKSDVDGAGATVVKSKTVLLPNDVPIEMVWCGPSVFEVSPGVSQKRKGFWIAKYELTQRQWKSVMRDNPSEFQNDTLPVENLSWNDCTRFLSALNARSSCKFRLPMGSEWEYAARGGPKGEMLMPPDDFAWWGRNSDDLTHVGGSKKPNALGLYDVLGNVWEWCAGMGAGDNYGKRELRGGSFCNNNQKLIDAKTPMYSDQDVAGRGAGLRLVCDDL